MREKEMRGELLVCKERRFRKGGRGGKGNKGSKGEGGVEDGLGATAKRLRCVAIVCFDRWDVVINSSKWWE
jgi:hypothetical protein